MALPINIEDLLHQRKVERTRIEYKTDWNPEPIVHSITAFANDFDNMGGGYIIIGVEEENGRPKLPLKGLNPDSLDAIQQDLLNKCNFIEPRYIPVVEPYTIDGKDILVLWVPGGDDRPYKCPEKLYTQRGGEKSHKAHYIRKGSRTIKTNSLEERELMALARDIPFDDRINYHGEVTDLNVVLLADYLRNVGSDLYHSMRNRPVEAVATDMHLVGGPSEYLKPLNIGLMFFYDHPERFFPYAQIEVVDKPDPTGIGMTEKTFRGPLDRQLRDALAYIQNYIITQYVTKVPDNALAIRAFNWPYQAVEEALCNAVYHKSYQIHEPVTVTVTPSKMEILSIPGPDRSITDEQLSNLTLISKRYRNRRIGDFLKELSIVEGRNTGVPLIVNSMKNNGSNPPVFETDEDRSYFLTTLPIHPLFLKSADRTARKPQKNESARRSKDELRRLVLKLLAKKGNLSTNEISSALGYVRITNTLRAVVNEMLKAGEVVYLYPNQPNSRNQKLQLKNAQRPS
ncbi:MAG: putative DNA binding domain-containing protein [Succinivibrionaceae bacterium]|nr:putative DNA binding domain-containing protein [Succinivibrionaceae bacterium]